MQRKYQPVPLDGNIIPMPRKAPRSVKPKKPKPTLHVVQMTEDDYRVMSEEGGSVCLSCKELNTVEFAEPDARELTCDGCDEPAVYGLEEALIMGMIEFVAPEQQTPEDEL